MVHTVPHRLEFKELTKKQTGETGRNKKRNTAVKVKKNFCEKSSEGNSAHPRQFYCPTLHFVVF